ncbi:hypothetical protein DID88_004051 [Monilinia fructigena]|uniref:DUF1748-domain-containing protein n=1 Tax=Monilinia fructigena TaxID=38457 RepID=A0A395IU78_9HELO|nr:hypothetical protein DID88_004051 [Monilinia fructigena]
MLGKLTHYAFDAVLLSAFLAGMKRSTGLTPSLKKDITENKELNSWIEKYLGVGHQEILISTPGEFKNFNECLNSHGSSKHFYTMINAAIVAHPYAPLGGSYDDGVVDLVASTILKEGFVVGTFNFRGAGSSKGHTSWSSIPEQKDYISFLGFMVTYLHHLNVPSSSQLPLFTQSEPQLQDLTPVPSQRVLEPAYDTIPGRPMSAGSGIESFDLRPLLLLAGYSYGSLITINLEPSHLSMLNPFQQPVSGSPYADIRSRARFLATQQNEVIETAFSLLRVGNHRRAPGLEWVGDEDIRRASHDMHGSGVKRSFSVEAPLKIRRSLDKVKFVVHNGSPRRVQSYHLTATQDQDGDSNLKNVEKYSQESQDNTSDILGHDLKVAYLLVSPLPPDGMSYMEPAIFSSMPKTFERWTEKLSNICRSRDSEYGVTFRYEEIADAEHFWRSPQAAGELRGRIRGFFVGDFGVMGG